MEAIILEPKNKEELEAVKKTIKEMGVISYSVSIEKKELLKKFKRIHSLEKGGFTDYNLMELSNKKDRREIARYKLATLPKRNSKTKANMELINEVLWDIRKPKNARKKV